MELKQLMAIPKAQDLVDICKELEFGKPLDSLSNNAEVVLKRQE